MLWRVLQVRKLKWSVVDNKWLFEAFTLLQIKSLFGHKQLRLYVPVQFASLVEIMKNNVFWFEKND